LVDDVGEVCEEVALVLVGEDGGDTCVVELDVFVVYSDEVNGGMGSHERREGIRDDLGDGTLRLSQELNWKYIDGGKYTS